MPLAAADKHLDTAHSPVASHTAHKDLGTSVGLGMQAVEHSLQAVVAAPVAVAAQEAALQAVRGSVQAPDARVGLVEPTG